ncbi:MAG: hypothetical protein H7Y88_00025 [Phycisphaerales bacterium]|nr:hypothetical protein [Phycisphaerales bacterium]
MISAIAGVVLGGILGQPAVLSKDELRQIAAVRETIGDIRVSFSHNVDGGPANLFARSHRSVVKSGDRIFVSHAYGRRPDLSTVTVRRDTAFDGSRFSLHEVNRGMALVHMGRDHEQEVDTQTFGFFDLAMLNDPDPNGNGFNDQSLESLLTCDVSVVVPVIEDVNGVPCHVVEIVREDGGGRKYAAWLDASRGCLPMRQWYYDASGVVAMELVCLEAQEAAPGIWLPVIGQKNVGIIPGMPETETALTFNMVVDGAETGEAQLTINGGVSDEEFELWDHLPAGTELFDVDIGAAWTITAGDPADFNASIDLAVQSARTELAERPPVVNVSQPAIRWTAVGGAGFIAMGLGVSMCRRTGRPRSISTTK